MSTEKFVHPYKSKMSLSYIHGDKHTSDMFDLYYINSQINYCLETLLLCVIISVLDFNDRCN